VAKLLLNGELKDAEAGLFTGHNRMFRYGDGLFESMRMINGELCFPRRHMQRLLTGVQLLQLRLPDNFLTNSLEAWAQKLWEENGNPPGSRLRLSVFRNDGGYYAPEVNDATWLLELWPMEHDRYAINEKGISVDLYQDIRKPINKLSSLKTANALLYVLASLHATAQNVDDAILINTNTNVIEATGSNLFAVKNGVLYSAPVSEGCVAGVMRSVVMEIAQENRIAVYEVPLPLSVLLNSDEIFLTNAVKGITWVGAYRAKRYYSQTARKLNDLLNKKVNAPVSS
jgi:branched-chain amino acid aminotransferase